jgi:hypothetical protein
MDQETVVVMLALKNRVLPLLVRQFGVLGRDFTGQSSCDDGFLRSELYDGHGGPRSHLKMM